LTVDEEGKVTDVIHGGPAYNAGLGPGMKVVAINGQQYSSDEMKNAVDAAKSTTTLIELLIANGAQYKTFRLNYHDGLRYPHLERENSRPDYLGEIFHPLAE
jgi:predicted metalloprotease with PDZ domain